MDGLKYFYESGMRETVQKEAAAVEQKQREKERECLHKNEVISAGFPFDVATCHDCGRQGLI